MDAGVTPPVPTVGGCGCPSSCSISLITFASWAFKNSAPSSASAADAATSFSIKQVIIILPFKTMGSPSFGKLPRKKYPPARLLALAAVKYDASECMLSTMLESRNLIFAFGFVACKPAAVLLASLFSQWN